MQKDYDVAVIFGGVSSENEVSVITGTMVCNVLKKGGKSVLPVYIGRDNIFYSGEELSDIAVFKREGYKDCLPCFISTGGVTLYKRNGRPAKRLRVGCFINCCHGGCCEGGAIAGAAALAGVPLASAGMFESAAFMDKYCTKLILTSLGVSVLPYAFSADVGGAVRAAEKMGYPVLVKPVSLGSSIGIRKAEDGQELIRALTAAFTLDSGVLVEEFIKDRREINCAAYMAENKVTVSPPEEAFSSGELLSYDDKYSGGGTRTFPAKLDEGLAKMVQDITERVYTALNMRGIVRFDYLLRREGKEEKIYLSEINTVPGSLSQYLVSKSYADFYRVLCGLIKQAERDFKNQSSKKIITTGILNNIAVNSCKIK